MLAADRRVASAATGEAPGDVAAGQGMFPCLGLAGKQVHGHSARHDHVAVEHHGPAVFEVVLPQNPPGCPAMGDHASLGLVSGPVDGAAACLEEDVVVGRVAQPGTEDVIGSAPELLSGADVEGHEPATVRHG